MAIPVPLVRDRHHAVTERERADWEGLGDVRLGDERRAESSNAVAPWFLTLKSQRRQKER